MISLVKSPQKYTPVNNPIVFQIQSDDVNIQYFAVQLLDSTGAVVNNFRLFTSPSYRNGTVADFSNIIYNTVNYQLKPSSNLIESTPATITGYQLNITEKVYSGGLIVDGVTITTSMYYTWLGGVDKIKFNSFSYTDYVTVPFNTANFLTNKPDNIVLNYQSSEYLSFINDGSFSKVVVNTYNKFLLGSYSKSFTGTSQSLRIDVSPASLNREFGFDFNGVDHYTIQLLDSANAPLSKVKSYRYKTLTTSDRVEILFANKLGGFDSCTFLNIRQTINEITPTTITKNQYEFNSTGNYSEVNGWVYNPEKDTININYESSYKAITNPLNDAQTVWLKELLTSEKVYVKLPNGGFLPIQIKNTSYGVNRQKFNQNLMRLELEFTTGSYDGALYTVVPVTTVSSSGNIIFADMFADEFF